MVDALKGTKDVLDLEVLQSLKDLGGEEEPELFRELVELFCRDAKAHVEKLEQSVHDGDRAQVESSSHALKSSSANLGARRLASLCQRIESTSQTEELTKLLEAVAPLAEELQRVHLRLQQELASAS